MKKYRVHHHGVGFVVVDDGSNLKELLDELKRWGIITYDELISPDLEDPDVIGRDIDISERRFTKLKVKLAESQAKK